MKSEQADGLERKIMTKFATTSCRRHGNLSSMRGDNAPFQSKVQIAAIGTNRKT